MKTRTLPAKPFVSTLISSTRTVPQEAGTRHLRYRQGVVCMFDGPHRVYSVSTVCLRRWKHRSYKIVPAHSFETIGAPQEHREKWLCVVESLR